MKQSNMGRHEEKNRRHGTGNIVMWLAGALFCLVVLTTYLSAGLFARYVTRDDGGDSARVITFGKLSVAENNVVGATGQEYIYIPGVNLTKRVTVSFGGSEADTFVFISLEAKGWERVGENFVLKDSEGKDLLSWSVDEDWKALMQKEIREGDKVVGTQYVYYMLLDSNKTLVEQQVIKDDTIKVSRSSIPVYDALQGTTLHLNVVAYAVQANGFYTAENDTELKAATAAWNSANK